MTHILNGYLVSHRVKEEDPRCPVGIARETTGIQFVLGEVIFCKIMTGYETNFVHNFFTSK